MSATQTKQAAAHGGYSGKVVIDPISRIAGHFRIEVELDRGRVTNAWSGSQLFRGLEIILQGRDPQDAKHFTQRACGVSTHTHALASTRAVENVIGVDKRIPAQAILLRNLLLGAQYLHEHIVHFYHLHALDWVDVVSALSADPEKAAVRAHDISPRRRTSAADLKAVQARVKQFVASGQPGIFSNAYFLEPHPAYTLPPEVNLIITAHYLEALKLQMLPARMMALLGGKSPHTQSLIEGGITCYEALKKEQFLQFKALYQETMQFIQEVYVPDVLAIASHYPDWGKIGSTQHFSACGEFPENEADLNSRYLPSGTIFNRKLSAVTDFNPNNFEEHVAYSWYKDSTPRHPWNGVTEPQYTDMDHMGSGEAGKYSWLKALRLSGKAMEVGPLAQCLVSYARGHKPTVFLVNKVLKKLDAGPEMLFSTLGRTTARCIQTVLIGQVMDSWLTRLEQGAAKHDTTLVAPWEMPRSGFGAGFVQAPGGILSHWIEIENKAIKNYQLIMPSAWNLGPRSTDGTLSPVEEALIGTPVADPKRPVEILRTVHSFL